MAKIVAVANQKGGVGKTTTAVNLTHALHLSGKRVLLCDMDPQGHASLGFGVSKKNDINIYNVLISDMDVRLAIKKTNYGDVLPASTDLVAAEIELSTFDDRQERLKKALDKIKDDYDFIVIDCPPSLGQLTINSLTAADSVLVPVDCGFYALEGLSALMTTIRVVKKTYNPELEVEGILLTMFDIRTNLANQVKNEIKRYFAEKLYKTTIARNVRLAEAPSHGKPILEYDRFSRGAEGYIELCQEFLDNNKGAKNG